MRSQQISSHVTKKNGLREGKELLKQGERMQPALTGTQPGQTLRCTEQALWHNREGDRGRKKAQMQEGHRCTCHAILWIDCYLAGHLR